MLMRRWFAAPLLREDDFARFNQWLWITRLRSVFGVLVIVLLVRWTAAVPALQVGPILAVCAADLAPQLLYYRWLQTRRHLRLLAYAQLTADTLALIAGLFFVIQDAAIFHFLLLLAVVPASMLEWQCGLTIAALATAGHFALLWGGGRGEFISVPGLVPPASFLLIAGQSLFYAQRLSEKNLELAAAAESLNETNQRLEEEAAISGALLRAAQALTTSLDPDAIFERLNDVVREAVECDFSATLLYDERSAVYRVASASGASTAALEEVRDFEFPRGSVSLFDLVAQQGLVSVEHRAPALFPSMLLDRWRVGSFLCADLRLAGESVGILAAGFTRRRGPFSPREMRLLRSIAQQAAVALENARLVERLRAASRLKSEFIGTMSHELRSPLNVVIGYVDLLLDGELGALDSQQHDALVRVQQHALQLLDLIHEALDINRLEAGLLPVDIETFSARDIVEEVRESIPADWQKSEVQFGWQIDASPLLVRSDRAKLKKILRNLIQNALKFTDRGSVTVKVTADGAWVDFAVCDTGIGISREDLPLIFEMFRQLDGSATRRHGGVGLGLYIVKQLVRGLGGDINVNSRVGVGSDFHVRLRRAE